MPMGPELVPELEAATLPFQPSEPVPPVAVQVVAWFVDHDRTMACPVCVAPGVAVKLAMVAAGAAVVTVTPTVLGALVPPGPAQVRVKFSVPTTVSGPTLVPALAVATGPLQPSDPVPPLAVQELALLLDHARVVDCVVWSEIGAAVNEPMVAGGGVLFTSTVTEPGEPAPPGPEQVSVYT